MEKIALKVFSPPGPPLNYFVVCLLGVVAHSCNLALGGVRQKDLEFKIGLRDKWRPCLQKAKATEYLELIKSRLALLWLEVRQQIQELASKKMGRLGDKKELGGGGGEGSSSSLQEERKFRMGRKNYQSLVPEDSIET